MSEQFQVTDEQRELAVVVDELANMIDRSQDGLEYWAEELIPPMTEDPDEVVASSVLEGNYLPQGEQLGFTLWHGDKAYRISVSKLRRDPAWH